MINPVGAALKTGTDRATGNAAQVSSDQFLRLLVTQLQNQDPLNPLSNEEFLSQMAQFQMLEEMMETSQNTASTMLGSRLSLAGGLIGRVVSLSGVVRSRDTVVPRVLCGRLILRLHRSTSPSVSALSNSPASRAAAVVRSTLGIRLPGRSSRVSLSIPMAGRASHRVSTSTESSARTPSDGGRPRRADDPQVMELVLPLPAFLSLFA